MVHGRGLRSDGFRLDCFTSFGSHSVNAAGDVNGDGFGDVIVGTAFGSGYVVFGRPGGFAGSLDLDDLDDLNGFRTDGPDGDRAGYSAAGAGDVNGHGYDDVIVHSLNANGSDNPDFFVVFGRGSGPLTEDLVSIGREAPVLVDVLATDAGPLNSGPSRETGPAFGTALLTDDDGVLYLPHAGGTDSSLQSYPQRPSPPTARGFCVEGPPVCRAADGSGARIVDRGVIKPDRAL